jgi:hypothetical protein
VEDEESASPARVSQSNETARISKLQVLDAQRVGPTVQVSIERDGEKQSLNLDEMLRNHARELAIYLYEKIK